MNPNTVFSASLVASLVLWFPSMQACLRGDLDLVPAALRYLAALIISRLAMNGIARLVNAYRATQEPEVRVDPAATKATIDATPARAPAGPYAGPATVEATAVQYARDGAPALAVLSTLTPDGRRALANATDAGVLESMTTEEWAGRPVELRTDGTVNSLTV